MVFLWVLWQRDAEGVYMAAVDPGWRSCGIGTALVEFVLAWMKLAGMAGAMVETVISAPVRHTYEKLRTQLFPIAGY